MRTLYIHTLGGLKVVNGEELVTGLETRKVEALLVYLAGTRRAQSREVLAELFWEGHTQQSAASNLRVALASLRKHLGDYLEISRNTVAINPKAEVWYDAAELENRLSELHLQEGLRTPQAAGELERGLDLYQGEFLEGFFVRDCPDFEAWQVRERERLHHLATGGLHELIRFEIQRGEYPAGLAHAARLLELDPFMEAAHRQMMELLALSGRRSEALAQYERCRKILRTELTVEPSAQTQALYERIRSGNLASPSPGQKTLRGYEIREQIGAGSFGAVYRAYQPGVGREVAIKVILPQYASRPKFIRRFESEARLVAHLEHPHIVPLYDFWREAGGAYLVMRYLRGGSLEDELRSGPLSPGKAASLVEQVAAALHTAHQQGVIHRDLKPANILLDEAGDAYLSDFGIARALGEDEDLAVESKPLGSPLYSPPEQIQAQELTPLADIYSLGLVAYQMLCGSPPYPPAPLPVLLEKQLHERLPSLLAQRPELPPEVDEVLQRAAAKNPGERYPDVLSFAAALGQALSGDIQIGATTGVEIINPYKGLQAFQEADAQDFFGRQGLTERLLKRLGERGSQARFLAVVGPSGSGKSSLVKAGLIPALRRGTLPGSEEWFILEMLPGSHPFEELEIGLLHLASSPELNLMEQLRRDARGLLRAVRLALPEEGGQLLLHIDQFEEIFTLVEDKSLAQRFIDSLCAAVSEPHSPLRVVITLRADFYDRPLMHPDFSRLVQDRTEVIVPLTVEELQEAIRRPAARVGITLEPELATAIVTDVVDQPGGLPLLEYALTELFERREGRLLTREAYEAIGGVLGALGRRAEEVFTGLAQPQQQVSRQMFLRMVTLGEGVEDTRRRALQAELESLADTDASASLGQSLPVRKAIAAFGKARLLSFDRDPITRSPTLEVAHEALLREWRRLREWLDESRADVRTQRVLSNAAAEWEVASRDPSFLLRGARLEQFESWRASTDLVLARQEREYLQASLAERQARQVEETARKERETSLERRARSFLRALVVILLLATIGSAALAGIARRAQLFAEGQSKARATQQAIAEAEAQSAATQQALAESEAASRATAEANAVQEGKTAQDQARLATSREFALAAINNLEVDPERSILLALQAYSTADTRQAEEALHRSVEASRIRLRLTGISVAYSPDGALIATGDKDGMVKLWDAQTGEQLHALSGHTDRVQSLTFSPDGARLASVSNDGTLRVWDVAQAKELLVIPAHTGEVDNVFFSPDGTRLTTSGIDDKARVWDAATGKLLLTIDLPTQGFTMFNSIGFLPDGNLLVANGEGEEGIRVVDLTNGQVIKSLPGYSPVAASPDGAFLATGDEIGHNMKIWDLRTLLASDQTDLIQPISIIQAHHNFIQGIAFSSVGNRLATASLDGTAKVWQISSQGASLIANLYGYTTFVWQAGFSPDGKRLATAGEDDTARVWDVTAPGSGELLTLAGYIQQVRGVAVQPQGHYLATSSWDEGTVEIWDFPSGRLRLTFSAHKGSVWDIAFSLDGSTLATVGADNATRVWDLAGSLAAGTGKMVTELAGHANAPPVGGVFPGTIAVDYSPDGKLLASAGADGQAIVWDLASSQELLSLPVASQGVGATQLAFSPNGSRLATGSDQPRDPDQNALVKIWDLSNGKELLTLPNIPNIVRFWGLAWSPDSKRLAASGGNGIAKVWDASTGQELLNLSGQAGTIGGLAFSPDGKLIASTGNDGTAKLWDASTGLNLATLTGHTQNLQHLAFSPDGRYLITASRDGTTQVDLVRIDDLIALAKTRVTRSLTPVECQQYLHMDTCPPNP